MNPLPDSIKEKTMDDIKRKLARHQIPLMNESELFKLFGKYARFVFGAYVIEFNGKLLSAETPSDLFEKVKKEYADVHRRK